MSCDDDDVECSAEGCEGEHGSFDDSPASDTVKTNLEDCYYEDSTYYEYVHTVNPENDEHGWKKVNNFTNIWLNGYFASRPTALIDHENCDYNEPYYDEACPGSVEFVVEHPQHHSDSEYKFRDEVPKNDDDANAVMETLLAVTAAAAKHPVARAGAAALGAWVDTSSGSGVDFEETRFNTQEGHGQEWRWSISVNGSTRSQFPQSPCDTNGVRFELSHDSSSSVDVNSHSRYYMEIPEYTPNRGCPCNRDFQRYTHVTKWASKQFTMEDA
jgi:hypothetical protein